MLRLAALVVGLALFVLLGEALFRGGFHVACEF